MLGPIDDAYGRAFDVEPRATAGALRFFARSGHAFVAEGRDGEVRGYLLAQAVFDGERAAVLASRMVSRPPGDDAALRALVRALTKSAYDAGVYDVHVSLPQADLAGAAALRAESYRVRPMLSYERRLGSRGRADTEDDHA